MSEKRVPVNVKFIDDNVNLCIVVGAQVSPGDDGVCAYVVDESTDEHREISDDNIVRTIAALADGDVQSALVHLVQIDESWFDALTEPLSDFRIANSHQLYERLVEGLVAVMITGGFPRAVFVSLLMSKFDEKLKEVTS